MLSVEQYKELSKCGSTFLSVKMFYGQNEEKGTRCTTGDGKRSENGLWCWEDSKFTFPVHSTRGEWLLITLLVCAELKVADREEKRPLPLEL